MKQNLKPANFRATTSAFFAVIFGFSSVVSAQSRGFAAGEQDIYYSRISEYFYNKTGREVLRPVQLLGGVAKPGLYHVPEGTSLTTLLAISGGPAQSADTDKIRIRKANGESMVGDLPQLLETKKEMTLSGGEIVFVPQKEGYFDQPTINTVNVISTIATVILTAILVHDTVKD